MRQICSDITVCIPSIPPRKRYLQRALRSVYRQTTPPGTLTVTFDLKKEGAAATRQRALDTVTTPYVAFLDDDDELWPKHLELLRAEIHRSAADLVYPWFEVIGGEDPFSQRYQKPFDEALLRQSQYVPITVLARTDSVRAGGGFVEDVNEYGWTNEDWNLWKNMLDNGAKFVHLPKRTWTWDHSSGNTSGNAKNW